MDKKSEKLYIVMPAYNEAVNIEEVVSSWYKNLSLGFEDSKLLVADSGSKDATHEILMGLKSKFPNLVILSDTLKEHGPKLIALYRYAINDGATFIFQTDSDGQTNPDEFKAFWDLKNDYDIVLGYRKVRKDGAIRKFVGNVVCLLLKIVFGVSVRDANAPFRLMNANILGKYIGRFKEDYNIPNIMLTTFFKYYNEKMTFREITFNPRKAGKNSINIVKIIKIGIRAIGDFYNFKTSM